VTESDAVILGVTVGAQSRPDAEVLADPGTPEFVKQALREPVPELIKRVEATEQARREQK